MSNAQKQYGYFGLEIVEFVPTFKEVDGETIQTSSIQFDMPATEAQYLEQESAKEIARLDALPSAAELLLAATKSKRQQLIADTDQLAVRHMRQELRFTAPEMDALAKKGKALTTAQFKELEAYTQALRDLPTTLKAWPAVTEADWPKKPAFMDKSSTTGA
jgi:ABC-type transporter Mla subunit MlaD